MAYNILLVLYYVRRSLLWLIVSMETFKEKVKELRRKMGWAQEDLAREIDVSLSTVQRWGGRGAKPTRLARRELARLFQEAGISNE